MTTKPEPPAVIAGGEGFDDKGNKVRACYCDSGTRGLATTALEEAGQDFRFAGLRSKGLYFRPAVNLKAP